MKNIIKRLTDVGFSEKEAKVYIASLESGNAPVSIIAEAANLNRITTYGLLQTLLAEGLVTMSEKRGVQHFSALSPDILADDIRRRAETLSQSVSFLKSLMGTHEHRPVVRFFDGISGVKKAYRETLKAKTEILNYANSKNIRVHWPEYDQEYVAQRKRKKIFLRGICPDDEFGKMVLCEDKKYFRHTRLLPQKHFWVENEIKIFDDKLFIASFEPQAFAIIIQSQTVTDTQRQIFEIAWTFAKQ